MGGSSDGPPPPPPNATPMPGVPITSGSGGVAADPFNYGKFQSFLPDIPASGPAPSATGLTSNMFNYAAPYDIMHPGSVPTPEPAKPAEPKSIFERMHERFDASPFGQHLSSTLGGPATGNPMRDALARLYQRRHPQQPETPAPPTPTPAPQENPAWMSSSVLG